MRMPRKLLRFVFFLRLRIRTIIHRLTGKYRTEPAWADYDNWSEIAPGVFMWSSHPNCRCEFPIDHLKSAKPDDE